MNAIHKWLLGLSGVVVAVSGCALPGLKVARLGERDQSRFALARHYEQQGETEKAVQIYAELTRETPQQAAPYHRLGVLAAQAGEHARAVQYFRQAQSLDPRNPDLLNDLGYAYFLQDRMPEAEKFLKLALQSDPQNERALNNLGLVLGRQGRTEESLAAFRRVLSESDAQANLALAAGQRSDASSIEGLYRASAPSRPAPSRAAPLPAAAHTFARSGGDDTGGLPLSGSNRMMAATATMPQRRGETNSSHSRELTGMVRTPRQQQFVPSSWSRGQWAAPTDWSARGASAKQGLSAAQRAAQRLQQRRMQSTAIAGGPQIGTTGAPRQRAVPSMEVPRLFELPRVASTQNSSAATKRLFPELPGT